MLAPLSAAVKADLMRYRTVHENLPQPKSEGDPVSRQLDSITLEHRLTYQGQQFQIIGISEIGRRVGLDITCERVGQ